MDYNVKESLNFNIEIKNGVVFKCAADYKDNKNVCKSLVYTNTDHTKWTISSWFTKPEFSNMGIGFYTMKKTLESMYENFGRPENVEYVWNGANSYVLKWLENNFDGVCNCPIAVQKTQSDDDWESHIYTLNVNKVLSYFELERNLEINENDLLR